MRIDFTLGNHPAGSHNSVMDIITPMVAGLVDMGHDVNITETVEDGDCLLILTDLFIHPLSEILPQFKRPYAVIQSELMTGKTFNNDNFFIPRYDSFMHVCDNAEFVIYLVGETNVNCPAFKCELGYSRFLENDSEEEKEFDLCFFGTPSGRRDDLIRKIASLGHTIAFCQNTHTQQRNVLLKKSRWNLGLKPHWNVKFPSITRINAALHCHTPTLYEHTESDTRVGSIPLVHDDSGDFSEWVHAALQDKDLEVRERQRQVALFKTIPVAEQLRNGFKSISYPLA